MGRSRGGLTTKIHALVDAEGRPIVLKLTEGQAHDGRSAAEMLDAFGIQQGGSQYRRLVASFQRIFGATIFFGTDTQLERTAVVHSARFNFMSEARIWSKHSQLRAARPMPP